MVNISFNRGSNILRILSILFLLGGLIRILADEYIFSLFHMGHLWTGHPYFLYCYKVLGGFVMLTGFVLYFISKDLRRYYPLLKPFGTGFLIIGIVMALTGYIVNLSLVFYLPDFLFCFILVVLFQYIRRKAISSDDDFPGRETV